MKAQSRILFFILLLSVACIAVGTEAQQPAPPMDPGMNMQPAAPPMDPGMNMQPGKPGDSGMNMSGHMYMTVLRPIKAGDQQKADSVAAAAKLAMEPYKDYKKALADGYEIFLPDLPQPQYHFTRHDYGYQAWTHFDPSKPTSLLYTKTTDDSYTLVGAMYTDKVDATEDELNTRIPLSIAHWHQHINFCKAPAGRKREYFGANAKFGLLGSITTQKACDAEGGEFHPHIFGWMVHVYPYETDPKKVWAIDDDDQGHDNMDHAPLPGMAPGMKTN